MHLEPAEREAVIFHLALAATCALTLAVPLPAPIGPRVLGLVLIYNVALPLVARWRGHTDWLRLWSFLVPLSAALIVPDGFLAVTLQTLVFPDLGGPRLGEVPLFMAGLWTIPLFAIVLFGLSVAARRGERVATWGVAAASFVVFVGAEALLPMLSLYAPLNVTQIGWVAVYVIAPITLLGLQAYWAYVWTRERPWGVRLAAAFTVMVLYLGGLALAYFLIESMRLR